MVKIMLPHIIKNIIENIMKNIIENIVAATVYGVKQLATNGGPYITSSQRVSVRGTGELSS